ncbi:MAG TPA: MFS transporter [Pyrinomonadaceae bacterium]|jgi:UMF1 family MFS transporter|nr:MFS transporter [Pyrinomonadaceae bacterium]
MSLPNTVKRWAFYDFANSSYVLIFQSFLLPVYFSSILVNRGFALSAWGLANGLSTLLGVLLSVAIGNYADKRNRINVFKWTVAGSFLGMCLVAFAVKYLQDYVFHLYVLTNALFIVTLSLSDSILPYLADKKEAYRYSGFAWGFGYVGGIVSLIVVIILQRFSSEYAPPVFLSVAIFYILFSVYALYGLRRVKLNQPKAETQIESRLGKKKKGLLLLGYWLISECITVIVLFYSIYAATELKLSSTIIAATLLAVQIVAFPATWYGGRLASKGNSLYWLGLSIFLWGIVIVLLTLNLGMIGLALIVLLTGLIIGNSQSYLRAQYSTFIDKSESGFQFGIYSFISQAAVFVGPIIYGYASDYLKSQKIPLLVLFALMLIGYLLIWKVTKQVDSIREKNAITYN